MNEYVNTNMLSHSIAVFHPLFLLLFLSLQERLKAETLNQHLRRQMADYQAPGIIEYMHVKDKQKKLQQSIHTLERKVGIAEVIYFHSLV